MITINILSQEEIRKILNEELAKKLSNINKAIDNLRIRINDLERIRAK